LKENMIAFKRLSRRIAVLATAAGLLADGSGLA